MTLHCSVTLARGMPNAGGVPARAANILGDWYAVAVTATSQRYVLAINGRSLLVVAFPVVQPQDLVMAFQQAVAHLLLRVGLTADEVERELSLMTPTLPRPIRRPEIPGRLYASLAQARSRLRAGADEHNLLRLEDDFAATPRQALARRTPSECALAAFRHTAEVIELAAYRRARAVRPG